MLEAVISLSPTFHLCESRVFLFTKGRLSCILFSACKGLWVDGVRQRDGLGGGGGGQKVECYGLNCVA